MNEIDVVLKWCKRVLFLCSYTARMGKNKKKLFVEEVSPFTKTDMQRIGVFKQGGYVSIGDPYRTARSESIHLHNVSLII